MTSAEKKLILHVGTDKTGTSALQHLFTENPAKFQRAGVYYPCTGRGTRHQHHMLFAPICPFSKTAGFVSEAPWTELLGALAAEIDERPEQRILLSSELLSQGVEFPALAGLRDMFADLRVVLYLRRQDHYVMSRYEQAVKTLGACEPLAVEQVAIPDYWKLAQEWEAFAGSPEKLIIRPYEKDQFYGGSIYADFLHHALDMSLDDSFVLPESRDTNPRFHPEAVEFLRLANQRRQPRGAVSLLWHLTGYSLREAPAELEPFTRHNQIPPSERIAILDRCSAQNARVAKRYLERKDGALFADYHPAQPDDPASPQPLTPESCLDIARYLAVSLLDNPSASPLDAVRDLNLVDSVAEEILSARSRDRTGRKLLAQFRALRNEKEISFLEKHFTDYAKAIAAKDDHIAGQDRLIASLKNAASETSSALRQKDDYIAQQQDALSAQSAALRQKDDYIAQQQDALSALSAALRQKDDYLAGQIDALAARSAALQQKDDYIAQQQAALAAQSAALRDLQERVAELESYVLGLHGKLAWRVLAPFLNMSEIKGKKE